MARPTLQQELRRKRPFDLAEEEAALNLLRTSGAVREPFDRLFADYAISDPQYNVLRILRGHGGKGLPCTEIAAQMVSRMPDMTRLVDRLEKAGLVRRCRTDEDRRVILICVTADGLALLGRLDEPVRDLHRQSLGHLTRRELADLNRLLVKARSPS
jgi:DNA-binding MarR family transcriptional regulator